MQNNLVIKFRNRVEQIINSSKLDKDNFFSFEFFLTILSVIYCGIIKIRNYLYDKEILKSKKLPCKVISIGNITVGGTGKTPMTIEVAQFIKKIGYRVGVVSRGYKSKAGKREIIVSDGDKILTDAAMSGDEPYMMARKLKDIPVIIGKNRFRAGMLVIKEFNLDVIILDDGFQHLKLKRDIDLVLMDSSAPFGNRRMLPRGKLREPMSSIHRGNFFLLTRSNQNDKKKSLEVKKTVKHKPVFNTVNIPYIAKVIKNGKVFFNENSVFDGLLKDKRVFAFSGIAKNMDFKFTVKSLGCILTEFYEFVDHHIYLEKDLNKIMKLADKTDSEYIATTEKDYVKIENRLSWTFDTVIIGIKPLFINDEEVFKELLYKKIK